MNGRKIPAVARLIYMLFITASVHGCLMDGPADCGSGECIITVRAFDNSGAQLTKAEVDPVVLYVFDENLYFVQSITAAIGDTVAIGTAGGEEMHIVAWGNLGDNSRVNVGERSAGSSIELLPDTRSGGYSTPPDDLFMGSLTMAASRTEAANDLPLYRKVGSMAVTVRKLRDFAGYDDDDYSVSVRETWSGIGFDGSLTGERVSYRPGGGFDNVGEYYVPPFNIIPEPDGVSIELYHAGQLVTTVTRDNEGRPVVIREGELTNVLVELDGTKLSVTVSLSPWGAEEVWKEF